jgi:hypothetical protein
MPAIVLGLRLFGRLLLDVDGDDGLRHESGSSLD